MNYPIITLGRQLGSGGLSDGKMLAAKLDIPLYNKELITLAAQKSGLNTEFFEKADEKDSFSIIGNIGNFFGSILGNIHNDNYLCNETLFKIQSDVIKQLAEQEPCIFVGRCADYILRENPNSFAVFISANMDDRVQRIANEQNLTEKEAKTKIEQADKKRAEYYNYYSNKLWGVATSYHLCINTSAVGIEKTADILYKIFKEKFCTE
jgi:cytidylate kinase